MDKDDKKRAASVGAMLLATTMLFSSGCSVAHAESNEETNDTVIEYVIKKGDTLRGISRHFYDTAEYYDELAEYNDISNPNLIRAGATLYVPQDPDYLMDEVTPQDDEGYTYTIKKGDTLSEICNEYYGSSTYAWALATYNKLDNPNIIRTGRTLKIPTLEVIKKVKVRDYSWVIEEQHHNERHHGWCPILHPHKH